uniref:ENTH domain-containing protein n=1 Tax=Megaselia scalaris TaxID=36166 RepID=T1H6F4_MEGSC
SIQKALNGLEVPLKVKHARAIIISTFRTAMFLWEMLKTQPLMEQRFTAWKFCHLLHKVLREGHHSIISAQSKIESILQIFDVGASEDGVGICIDLYSKLLVMKIDFHRKNPAIPGSMLFEFNDIN